MKLNTFIPTIALATLASTSMMANANVVLQADNGNLLLNGKPAQLLAQVYDANDNVQPNIQIINNEGDEIKALVTVDDLAGLFEIRAYGYHSADGSGYGAGGVYNATCEEIGGQKGIFYNVGFVAKGSTLAGEQSQYEVYRIGGSVSGYSVDGLNLNYDSEGNITPGQDCSQGAPITGYALQYDANLTDSVNTYFNQLAFPLSIK